MIKKPILISGVLAVCVAVGLFQLKYEVAEQERQLACLSQDIFETEEAIHILEAEWSYLNEPKRLQKLAGNYLELDSSQPVQLVAYEQLEDLCLDRAGTADEIVLAATYKRK